MRGRNGINLARSKQLMKAAIAQRARRLFDAPAPLRGKRGNIPVLRAQRKIKLLRQIGNKLRIAIRLGATQSVMHMNGGEHNPGLRPHLGHRDQQRHRIRAS
jgi:hypothetical protein